MERPPPPPSPPAVDLALLVRYAAGDCSADERRRVDEWLRADPTHAARLDALRRGSLPADAALPTMQSYDVDAAWAKNPASRLSAGGPRLVREQEPLQQRPAARRTIRWGSSQQSTNPLPGLLTAAAAVVIGILTWTYGHRGGDAGASRVAPVVMTAVNELRHVDLPDGTHIVLAPSSELRLIATPEHGRRELALRGSAYFDVMHSADPFIVRTAGAVLEDLGTSFVVQAYPGDPALHVAVRSGEVAVSRATNTPTGASGAAPANRIVLTKAQVARIDTAGHITVASDPDIGDYFDWVDGKTELRLHDSPLPDVLAALGRRYGVDFTVTDSVLNRQRLTIALQSESLPEVLHILDEVLPARHTIRGTHVTLRAR